MLGFGFQYIKYTIPGGDMWDMNLAKYFLEKDETTEVHPAEIYCSLNIRHKTNNDWVHTLITMHFKPEKSSKV